jgi:hypothetical protein
LLIHHGFFVGAFPFFHRLTKIFETSVLWRKVVMWKWKAHLAALLLHIMWQIKFTGPQCSRQSMVYK